MHFGTCAMVWKTFGCTWSIWLSWLFLKREEWMWGTDAVIAVNNSNLGWMIQKICVCIQNNKVNMDADTYQLFKSMILKSIR